MGHVVDSEHSTQGINWMCAPPNLPPCHCVYLYRSAELWFVSQREFTHKALSQTQASLVSQAHKTHHGPHALHVALTHFDTVEELFNGTN